jgi:inactivated superfamily I helicase
MSAKKIKETAEPEKENNVPDVPKDIFADPLSFTGVARSMVCYNNNNTFRNFKIATLTIEKGKVTEVDYSDPYANFEAIAILEIQNERAIDNLNNRWEHGTAMRK